MPCYHPLTAYYARKENESGKRSLVFAVDKALVDVPIQLPCGRCIGCRLDRSLSWALRCVHEASLYDANCFITLTFSDSSLASDASLKVSDFQNFMKRLRQKISPVKVRFFHCGEYGPKFSRPHHHACLFGYDFPDKVLFKKSPKGNIYTSELLSKLWPFGFSTVGEVTFESAAYVARYVMKKWSKENFKEEELYEQMCEYDRARRDAKISSQKLFASEKACSGYYGGRHPEYITMSRRPGIGAEWYNKFYSDVYPAGFAVLVGGKKVKLPKFYDSRFELDNVIGFDMMKGSRLVRAQEDTNNSRRRLEDREAVKLSKSNSLIRGYENG